MTLDEFLNKLSRLRHKGSKQKVKWYILSDGRIRTVAENKKTGYYCPLTAVYKAEKGINVYLDSVPLVAIDLKLKAKYNDIIAAADNFPICDSNIYALRQKLLKACGLTEE